MPMLDRRRLLLSSTAGLAAAAAPGLLMPRRATAADLVVGFIYVGPKDDYGYNQAHAEGAAALKSMPGVTIIEEENVPETVDVQKTMESMINLDGASLVFPTSFGYYDPHMLKMCEKYPDVQFRHCGGMWNAEKHPTNAGSYFGYIGMGQYLNGIVAGHTSKSKKLGFIATAPTAKMMVRNWKRGMVPVESSAKSGFPRAVRPCAGPVAGGSSDRRHHCGGCRARERH